MMSVVTSCAHPGLESLKSKHEAPKAAYQSESSDEVTIAVVGINDFHGSLIAKERKLPDGRMVHSGGAASLAGMLKILRQEMKGRVLVVDAGDEWQGTLESNQFKGATVVEFFNRIGVKVAAIGNHEFDFNLDNMVQRFSEAKYKYVASNIFEKSTGKRVNWKNVRPSEIIEVDGIRFGVIGFSTTQTPSTTRYETVKHLEFRDPAHSVIQEATSLRSKKVNAVLVTAHAGSSCENRDELYDWKIHNSSNCQSKCDTDDEILKLATGLTPGLVDGFVSGHTHQVIHHFYGGAPVVQGEAYNQYFNIIYYTFNRKSGKLLSEKTRIEGVVPICDQFFEGTSHCDVRRLKADSSPELVPALFHGIKVEPDSDVTRWLTPIVEGTEKFRREVLTTTELPLSHYRDREGAFGNLIADVLREKGHADFALVNSGGVRTALDAGPITFDGLFRALPFDNLLNVVQLSGAEIKMLYRVASSGSHGVIAVSGLQLTLIPFDQVAPKSDLNQDGRLEAWETNRLLSIRTSEGKPIEDDQRYSVATFDFLVNGGDDLHWFMGKIPTRFISRQFSGYCRDLVSDYLKTQKVINTQSHPLVDPEHPRIIFKSGSVQ
jgi:2',3'-cyclic-nucleotide 2'-phosphodiesterase (5'-nucleotidase family)